MRFYELSSELLYNAGVIVANTPGIPMRTLLLATATLVMLSPAAFAQDPGFLVTFHFDTLWFKFHPNGLASTATSGSGLEVFAENVRVEGDEVKDLRHCIDGWGDDKCSYGSGLALIDYQADRDGNVTTAEVERFTPLALIFAGSIEKVKRLSDILQSNITVDGLTGGQPRVVELIFRDAEGPVDSDAPAFADVTVEAGYDNDRNAKRHEVHVKNFQMEAEGFVYQTVQWTLEGDSKWDYKAGETLPGSVQGRVTNDGWTSTQAEFESSTTDTLRLVVELPKKKTPGPELFAIVGALAIAALLVRRR